MRDARLMLAVTHWIRGHVDKRTAGYATMSNDIKPAACGWSQDGDS